MKTALVCGAGGFIGGHLVKRLKAEGFWVRGVDIKPHDYAASPADEFLIGDLRDPTFCRDVANRDFDEVYQLAADMGGAPRDELDRVLLAACLAPPNAQT